MDSIGTRLGSEMSYVQHMTDIIMDMYNIKPTDADTDEDEDEDEDTDADDAE
jgi:hypothetical protein